MHRVIVVQQDPDSHPILTQHYHNNTRPSSAIINCEATESDGGQVESVTRPEHSVARGSLRTVVMTPEAYAIQKPSRIPLPTVTKSPRKHIARDPRLIRARYERPQRVQNVPKVLDGRGPVSTNARSASGAAGPSQSGSISRDSAYHSMKATSKGSVNGRHRKLFPGPNPPKRYYKYKRIIAAAMPTFVTALKITQRAFEDDSVIDKCRRPRSSTPEWLAPRPAPTIKPRDRDSALQGCTS